jgi:hypothetical protein
VVIDSTFSLIGSNSHTGLVEAPVGSPDANGNLIGGPVHGLIDPLLGPLAHNGGPTQTHALLPGSPAINAGDPAVMAGTEGVPLHDQRGAPWSRVHGGRIDIGAFELQPNPLAGDYNFDGIVSTADYVTWRDTLGSTTNLRANGDDSNNVIDAADYGVWSAHFGEALGRGARSEARGATESIAGERSSAAVVGGTNTPVRPKIQYRVHGGLECPPHVTARMLALLDLLDGVPRDEESRFDGLNIEHTATDERDAAFVVLGDEFLRSFFIPAG